MSQPSNQPPFPTQGPPPFVQPPPQAWPPGTPQPLGYQTPHAHPAGTMPDLHGIANNQKILMYCILGYVAAIIASIFVPDGPVRIVISVALIGISLVAAVFVFMLSLKVFSTGVGILLGILTLIPCFGLIVLLVINGKATTTLKAYGIPVGLMGEKMSSLPPR